jgi:CBS domain containing-hemolysin-like protein
MTPRVRVSALEDTATAADVLNLTRATGLSRFPVYRGRLDDITGMVHLKDALAVPAAERDRTPVGRIAVAPLLVPETLPGRRLLELLRSQQPMAVVVDEYGGTAGVVTLEDIVEELVGGSATSTTPPTCPNSPRSRPSPGTRRGTPTAAAGWTPSPG